jgi:hypothetical protein
MIFRLCDMSVSFYRPGSCRFALLRSNVQLVSCVNTPIRSRIKLLHHFHCSRAVYQFLSKSVVMVRGK